MNQAVNVKRGHALTALCKISQKNIDPCKYFRGTERASKNISWQPEDIEDLHKSAEKHTFCPYYLAKERTSLADVVFMPYNYIIDPSIR